MVMPLSRYIAGDFITPVMRWSWDQGTPYQIIGPDGPRVMPPNVPYGGPHAPENWARFAPMIGEDFAARFPELPWDERSPVEPRFHRVDPRSYGALLEHAQTSARPRSGLAKLLGRGRSRPPGVAHLAASIFLPTATDVFMIDSPRVSVVGSAATALEALAADVPEEAASARETLCDALRDAVELRLPMVVDT